MWLTIRSDSGGGSPFFVGPRGLLIGREEDCDVLLRDEKVSRRHARLTIGESGQVSVQDLSSMNGTYVDGRPLTGSFPLRGGEVIRVGDTELAVWATDPAVSREPRKPPTDPRVGTTVGHNKYRILDKIQQGGMGVVYLAERVRVGGRAALKVLSPQFAQDQRFRQRFEREWKAAAAVEHPNILPVWDVAAEDEEDLYIAMPYIEGGDLGSLLEREGKLQPERALAILTQVAAALDAAHARGLIHRDVKPSNILISSAGGVAEEGHAFLCDFGITKSAADSSGLTQAGQAIGTVHYMAPEQIKGELPPDARTDEYALGCVLYECLTGHVPYDKDSSEAVKYAQVHEPPPRLSLIRPDLPAALDRVIVKAMSKSKEDRFPSCGEMVAAARAAVAEVPLPAHPPAASTKEDTRRPPGSTAGQGQAEATLVGDQTLPGDGRHHPPTPPRRKIPAAAVVAVLLAVALGFYLLTRDNGEPGTKATTPSPRTASLTAGQSELISHVPSTFSGTCVGDESESDYPATALGGVRCSFDRAAVVYFLFGDPSDLSGFYQSQVEAFGTGYDVGSCPTQIPSEGQYRDQAGTFAGRLLCFADTNDEAWIEWTDDNLLIFARTSRHDADMSGLYDVWNESGPL